MTRSDELKQALVGMFNELDEMLSKEDSDSDTTPEESDDTNKDETKQESQIKSLLKDLDEALSDNDSFEEAFISLSKKEDYKDYIKVENNNISIPEMSKVKERKTVQKNPYKENEDGDIEVTKVDLKNTMRATSKNTISLQNFRMKKPGAVCKVASKLGIDKFAHRQFKTILDALESEGINLKDVKTLGIVANDIYINNRRLDIGHDCFNENVMDLVDIVDFNLVYKKMKNIQYLILDTEAYNRLYITECKGTMNSKDMAVWSVFTKMENLNILRILKDNGKYLDINRSDLKSSVLPRIIQEQQNQAKMNALMGAACAGLNSNNNFSMKKTAKAKNDVDLLKSLGLSGNIPKSIKNIGLVAGGGVVGSLVTMGLSSLILPMLLVGGCSACVAHIAKAGQMMEQGGKPKEKKK